MVIKMLGQDAVWEFGKVSLSNSMIIDILISCHIMLKKFCVIIWKTTAPLPGWWILRFPSKCHAVAFIRFENDGEIREFFLYCKEQTGMSKGQEVFNVFPVTHKQNVCLGGTVLTSVLMVALSMLDSMRGFISL